MAINRRVFAMSSRLLLFVRHGQTDYNRRQIRCGGDVDIPLTRDGEDQARHAAQALRGDAGQLDGVFVSPLMRTRQTAGIILAELGISRVPVVMDGLIERRLGEWNGLDIETSQALFDAGASPPGGESEGDFRARIAQTLDHILAQPCRLPLVVSSKGVARVLGILAGQPPQGPAGNAQVLRFRF